MIKARQKRVAQTVPARRKKTPTLPELVNFINSSAFDRQWTDLNLNDGRDLRGLKVVILARLKTAPVVPGTHGLRKIRYAKPGTNQGKSSGVRVLFGYLEDASIVLLAAAISKNRRSNFSPRERAVLGKAFLAFKSQVSKAPIRAA
jgi:hypothetical protein